MSLKNELYQYEDIKICKSKKYFEQNNYELVGFKWSIVYGSNALNYSVDFYVRITF